MGFTTTVALVALVSSPLDRGDDDYQFIVGLCEQGLHEMAAQEAADFLREHRGHARTEHARYRLATSLFELGRTADARPHLERLFGFDDFEFAAEVAFRLGQCELERERFDAAQSAFERTIESGRDYLTWPATQLLGDAHFGAQRWVEAERAYAAVLAAEAEEARAWQAEAARGSAWCAFRTERWDETIAKAGAAKRRVEADVVPELDFLIGEAELEAGRPRRAITALERVTSGEFATAALRSRGFAHAELAEHEAAARAFGSLLEREPEGSFAAEAALMVGVSWLEAGRPELAREAYAQARLPETAEAELWRARVELANDAAAAALEALDRATRRPGGAGLQADIAALRGEALIALDRGADAARAFETAGDDYGAHAAAIAWLEAGRPDEAVRVARAHLRGRSGAPADGPYLQRLELALGEALFRSGRYDEARPTFEALLDPARGCGEDVVARALSRLGWCHYESGRPDAAVAPFERLVRELPRTPEADEGTYMWGRAACDAGHPDVAAEVWRGYLRDGSRALHRADCLLGLAEVETGTKREERLEAVVELVDDERAASALYDLGESRAAREDPRAAARAYRRLIEQHPDSVRVPAARYGLAWLAFEQERVAEAIAELDALLASSVAPDLRLAALELKVWCERAEGRPEAAFGAFQELTTLCADERRIFEAGHATAQVFVDAEREDFAVALYDELIRGLDDERWTGSARVERAYLALEADDRETADRLVRRALEGAPDHAGAREAAFFVGEAHFAAGDDERAIAAYRLAARDGGPAAEQAAYKLGFCLLRAERPAEAAGAFDALVERFPESELAGEGLFLCGEAHYRAGAFDAAALVLRRVVDEHPRHATRPKALFRLGLACGELGAWRDCDRALAELAQRAPDFPQIAEAEHWRGRARLELGDERGARSAWDRVVDLDRGVWAARARLSLGKLFRSAGQLDAALSEFLKVALLFAHEDEVAEALWLAGCTLADDGDDERAAEQLRKLVRDHPRTSWAEQARERLAGGSF